MTCREKLTIMYPEKIDPRCLGGCNGCPHDYNFLPKDSSFCGRGNRGCAECWNRTIPGTERTKLIAEIKPQIDISALINEAMEKKDRTVYILCYDGKMSIDVKPYTASDPRWIVHDDIPGRGRRKFECSECHGWSSEAGSYCQFCGEKLRMPTEEDFKKEKNI